MSKLKPKGTRILADERINDSDLDKRIAAAKAATERGHSSEEARAENRGWAVGIEFVGAVLVSGFIGWGIDNWSGLGTSPWAMIGMLFLGFIAGTRRALKTSQQFDADPATRKRGH
jgi:ATP synthase protein I